MKKLFIALLVMLGLVVIIPILGPSIGLAGYRASTPAPGNNVTLPGGRTLNVYRGGEGPAVVLVHGVPGYGAFMKPLGDALAKKGFSWLAYDRLGWGYSSARPDNETANPTNNAADLIALLKAEKIENAYLVGYSYGGGVVLEALRMDQGLAACSGLISSVGKNTRKAEPSRLAKFIGSAPVLSWVFGTSYTTRFFTANVFERLFSPEKVPSQTWVDGFVASTALPGVTNTWERENAERHLGFDGYKPEMVRTPTIIIHGSADEVVAPSVAEYLYKTLPRSMLEILDQRGHGIIATRTEPIAALLADWYAAECNPE